ncbi:MAG: peptidylprolyl isomerase [Phycisphaerae bacterium]
MRRLLIFLVTLMCAGTVSSADSVVRFAMGGYDLNTETNQWEVFGWYIDVRCFDEAAPGTVDNFLRYVNDGLYDNTIWHRSSVYEESGNPFVLQGGGYKVGDNQIVEIPSYDTIDNEYGIPNYRGTLAMAKKAPQYDDNDDLIPGTGPDSATNQFFFNLDDENTSVLGPGNNGGYSVFAHVLGEGMNVVDYLAGFPTYNLYNLHFAFSETPVNGSIEGGIYPQQFLYLFEAEVITDLDGDLNLDGVVDSADAEIFRQHYGGEGTWAEGDFDGDFDVDFRDAWRLLENYSGPESAGDMAEYLTRGAVPEPGSLAILGVIGAAMLRRRQQR